MSTETTSQLRSLTWIAESPFPADYGGPVDAPFQLPAIESPGGLGYVRWAAKTFPDKIAVTDGSRSLTYAEFLDRCMGLSAQIYGAVRPGGVVVSLLHNGPAATCAVVATFGSGRTFIPIDAGHPVERQAALFRESHAAAVIVEEGVDLDTSFIPSSVPIIMLDVTKASGVTTVPPPAASNGPALVMFTSGSTGRPKGLAYGGAHSDARERFITKFHITPDDVFASLASMSQTGLADLLAISAGAELHVVDIRRVGLAAGLAAMKAAGVTFLSFVPSVLRTLMAFPGIEDVFANLRILGLHGERILASDIKLIRSKLPPDCKISITYGSTEAGAIFSWFVRDEAIDGPVVPIGYLVHGMKVALVAEDGSATAPGDVGELLVRGPMALGSWQNGQVTPARFLPDPEDPTSKIYATGDLVRQRPDKLFEFVGRRDRQVKIRGLWADLGEIESVLRATDNVDDAVVVVRTVPGAADTLAAFITLADPTLPPELSDLRRAVAAGAAEHMVPSDIRVLSEIPRLANYKPDLQRLDAMLQDTGSN